MNNEQQLLWALDAVLSKRYPTELYSVNGYQEESVCIAPSSSGWSVYFAEDENRHELSRCSTLLFACLTMLRKMTHDKDEIAEMEAEFIQAVFGSTLSYSEVTKYLADTSAKREIKLQFDYLNGPVWKEHVDADSDGMSTGVPRVDGDPIIKWLDEQARGIYESVYSSDKEGKACSFNEDMFNFVKPALSVYIQQIKNRLSEINDGSFVVVDLASRELNKTPASAGRRKNLSYGEKMDLLAAEFQKKIDLLNSLPPEEARKVAHEDLIRIGYLDQDGNLAEPYRKMREQYEEPQ